MGRVSTMVGFAVLLCLSGQAWGQEAPDPRSLQALQDAVHKTIQLAEPSIACILVSRNELYTKLPGFDPGAGSNGKLGSFELETARIWFKIPPNEQMRLEELRKLDLADPDNVPESFGSGVVVDERGLVLTNYHVIREATKIYVRLPGGRGAYADIHAADQRSDLAVLRLLNPGLPLRAIRIGDGGKVRKGDFVVSLANPFAAGFRDGSPSASWGIVSNLRRRGPGNGREEDRKKPLHQYGVLLQTDARLNHGCSGGALLDLKGELIGLTTALAAITGSETAGGYALAMNDGMKRVVEVLKRGEEVEYGFLGVSLRRGTRRGQGAQISDVSTDSPAQRAGLQRDETILTVNGIPVEDFEDLLLAVNLHLAGSQIRMEVRSPIGSTRTVTATLVKYWTAGPNIASRKPAPVRGLRVDYTSTLLKAAGEPIPQGVLVIEVQSGSRAEAAQLKKDDIILEVNARPVNTPAEFYREAGKVIGPLELTLSDRRKVRVN